MNRNRFVERAGIIKRLTLAVLVSAMAAMWAGTPRPALAALTPPAVPELEPGAGIINDKQAAIALGKALFWDEQAGSDGMACASCHFSAGADNRIRNQLSPGFNDAHFAPSGDKTFGSTQSDTSEVPAGHMPSGDLADSNYTLKPTDFPLHQLVDYTNRNSTIRSTTNDVVSSSGAYSTQFARVSVLGMPDRCSAADGSIFHAGAFPARQVEPRNTPTTVNSAFFHSNFWDGRANNLFNGVGVFGMRDIEGDPNKRLIVLDSSNTPQLGFLQIRNASLASQAVGPPLSTLEMSCQGRTFADVGRRLLFTIPLLPQQVAKTDGLLGGYVSASGRGLALKNAYAALIMKAFDKKYWGAPGRYKIANGQLGKSGTGYAQIEQNFSMFWGISIMLYERTLISDQSRFDTWFASCRPAVVPGAAPPTPPPPIANPTVTCLPAADNPNQSTDPTAHGLTAAEVLGFALFNGTGNPRAPGNPACGTCHGPTANARAATGVVFPVLSEAAYTSGQTGRFSPVERSFLNLWTESFDPGTGQHGVPTLLPAGDQRSGGVHDRGFFNIGVTPASVDPGNGGRDPYGNPLSLSRMFLVDEGGGSAIDAPLVMTPATFPDPVTGVATNPATLAERITLTGTLNRCSAPGLIEPGGTPRFLGCTDNVGPPTTGALDTSQERELVDGGFKTPSLRNVGLTAPYFHTGNYSDLRSVMQFYARGSSRRSTSLSDVSFTGDTSGTGPLGKGPHALSGPEFGTNVDFFIRDIKSTDEQVDALVAFMLTLTDPRVQCDRYPFDHPSLTIRHGHAATDKKPKDGKADDLTATLPAVGAEGYGLDSGYCLPNKGNLFAPGAQGRAGGSKSTPADL